MVDFSLPQEMTPVNNYLFIIAIKIIYITCAHSEFTLNAFFFKAMPDLMLDSLSGQESMWGLLIINSMTETDKTIIGEPAVQLFCSGFLGGIFCLFNRKSDCL